MNNKINKILNEEIVKYLNESYVLENENLNFRQEIKTSSFFNYDGFSDDFDTDILESDIFINWHVTFRLNDLGIENFIVEIDSVDGVYRLSLLNKQSDEMEQQNDKDISEIPWKFIIDDATLYLGKTLYVESMNFDFSKYTCNVNFYDYGNN